MSKEKKILAFGAGKISKPCVQYLLRRGYKVMVVDQFEQNVLRTAGGHPNAVPVVGNAVAESEKYIREFAPDVVVCMLPTAFMAQTAKTCLDEGVSMIGASYAKEPVRALDAEAKAKGLRILCEMGVDPGIDHMSAVHKIKEIQAAGGEIESFVSVCGALPDLSANNNPIGYKLSWAPESLVGASLRDARIMTDGAVREMNGGTTYQNPSFMEIKGLGWFETYCNADSIPYLEAYGIDGASTIERGTLRYPGWCEMVTHMQKLRIFDEEPRDFGGYTYAALTKELCGMAGDGRGAKACAAEFLGVEPYSTSIMKLEWLGLFDEKPVMPANGSLRDMITAIYGQKLVFEPGEKDIVVMQHQYVVREKCGARKRVTSTMVDRGVVSEESAIARTTGLPMGIGAHLAASGAVKGTGVLIPTTEDIYVPALEELGREGISFAEHEEEA